MLEFTLYAIPDCPYCDKAKQLLEDKNISYEYIVLRDIQKRKEIGTRYNMKTAPIILHNNNLVGGYTELKTYFSQNF